MHRPLNNLWESYHQQESSHPDHLNTGVDYAELISLRIGTTCSKIIIKGYIATFVCFATKAIHIQVDTS